MTQSTGLQRNKPTSDTVFRDELDKLEKCLATPVVPGELVNWFDTVEAVLAQAGAAVRRQIRNVHPTLLSQISHVEVELRRNVDQLRKDDEDLLGQLDETQAEFLRLGKMAERVEPDEGAIMASVTKAADRGLLLIVAARKQETAIQSWFLEAFNRENGTGD